MHAHDACLPLRTRCSRTVPDGAGRRLPERPPAPSVPPVEPRVSDGAGRVRTVTVGVRIPPLQPPRTNSMTPGASGLHIPPPSCPAVQQPPSWAWFEQAGRWGATMPVTRDSPSIQGDVLAQTPPGLPLTRLSPRRGSLVGAAGGGLPCQPRSATRRAAAPTSGTCLVHVWATHHRNRAVPSGSQRYLVR